MISQLEQAVNAIDNADPAAIRLANLEAENKVFKTQLEWFKRQILAASPRSRSSSNRTRKTCLRKTQRQRRPTNRQVGSSANTTAAPVLHSCAASSGC